MSVMRTKRLLKEIKMVRNDEDIIESVKICDGDIGKWKVNN